MSIPGKKGSHAVFLQPGEFYCARRPSIVETILGSCIAVTLYSPPMRTGAICHAMLPSPCDGAAQGEYVEGAIKAILGRMLYRGLEKDALEAKLFGGSTVLPSGESSIGEQNIKAALEVLEKLQIRIVARDVGGDTGRKLFFCTETGDVYVRRQKSSPARRIADLMEN